MSHIALRFFRVTIKRIFTDNKEERKKMALNWEYIVFSSTFSGNSGFLTTFWVETLCATALKKAESG